MHRAARLAGRHLLPAAVAVAFLLPLAAMVLGSLRPVGAAPPGGIALVPPDPTLESWRQLGRLLPVGTYLRNSVGVAVVAVPLTVAVAAAAGFGIRLLPWRAGRLVVLASAGVLVVPASALWATRFEVYAALGLIGSLLPLVAPSLLGATPFLVLVYAWAFFGVPDSQLDAARLEGAGTWQLLRRVALPQVRPATVAVAVLAFTFHWGNAVDALLYLRGQHTFTLPVGLASLKLLRPTELPLLMAGAAAFALPAAAVFLLAHRLFDDDPLAALRGGPSEGRR